MSFQGFSQASPLAFDTIVTPGPSNLTTPIDLGDYTFSVDSLNSNDTLFYLEFIDQDDYLDIYYGIIDNVSDSAVDLKLYLETDNTSIHYWDQSININNSNITLSNETPAPLGRKFKHNISYTYNDSVLDFNPIKIRDIKFKFNISFTGLLDPNTGFNDFFTEAKTEFKVYPNPCENTLNIEADGLKRIFDTSGRLIKESYEDRIDMSDLAPGMYVVMLENGAREKVFKE